MLHDSLMASTRAQVFYTGQKFPIGKNAPYEIHTHLVSQNDQDGAKTIQSILRKRGVPLQASGYAETLPRDGGSRLPLV